MKWRACARVHGGYGYGGCDGDDYAVAVQERLQKRLRACCQAVDLAQGQRHVDQEYRVATLRPEGMHARRDCWVWHPARVDDYGDHQEGKHRSGQIGTHSDPS